MSSFNTNPGNFPAAWGSTPGAGAVPPSVRRPPGQDPNAAPLQQLISPEVTIPFASNILPGPDAATVGITAANVGYFGLQLVEGATRGMVKLCGINAWIGPTYNVHTGGTTFPSKPEWQNAAPNQDAGYGNPVGTGAGLIVALEADLPFRPRAGQWVAGEALFPWLQPGFSASAIGTWYNNYGGNRQIWGTPFAAGNLEVDYITTKEIVVRDTPLGWDIPLDSRAWVLIAIDGNDCINLGDAARSVFCNVHGNLVLAAQNRRFQF